MVSREIIATLSTLMPGWIILVIFCRGSRGVVSPRDWLCTFEFRWKNLQLRESALGTSIYLSIVIHLWISTLLQLRVCLTFLAWDFYLLPTCLWEADDSYRKLIFRKLKKNCLKWERGNIPHEIWVIAKWTFHALIVVQTVAQPEHHCGGGGKIQQFFKLLSFFLMSKISVKMQFSADFLFLFFSRSLVS